MSIGTPEELEGMRRVGAVVAEAIDAVVARVRPGVSTARLDRVAALVFARHGARSAPRLEVGFPATICLSVGDEACHGIPGGRRLRDGDLLKIDVTAELDGFFADACRTVACGTVSDRDARLAACADAALAAGLDAARAGARIRDIGAAVERRVRADGFSVCAALTGHGIGRAMHEPPTVPSVPTRTGERLTPGLVLTIEPIIAAGRGDVVLGDDGWTISTADGSTAAHAEHTLVVQHDGPPLVLTA